MAYQKKGSIYTGNPRLCPKGKDLAQMRDCRGGKKRTKGLLPRKIKRSTAQKSRSSSRWGGKKKTLRSP